MCGNSANRPCPHRVDIKSVKGSVMEILEIWLCVTVNNGCPERVSGRVVWSYHRLGGSVICPLSLGSCTGWTWLPVLTSVTELCLSWKGWAGSISQSPPFLAKNTVSKYWAEPVFRLTTPHHWVREEMHVSFVKADVHRIEAKDHSSCWRPPLCVWS